MSTKTTKDSSLQTTKQMLDELDALMEKMLTLPVNDPEDAAPFPEEVVKAPSLPSTVSATLTLLEPPPLSEPPPPMEAEAPPLVEMAPPVEAKPAPQPEPLTNDIVPPRVLPSLDPLLVEI